jgi:hypothetical protein
MAGNTSKYEIITDRRTNTTKFIKTVDEKSFDFSTVAFQQYLSRSYKGSLKIPMPIGVNIDNKKGSALIEYDYVENKPWEVNEVNITELGKLMAQFHDYCYREPETWTRLDKKVFAVNMGAWDSVENSHEKTLALDLRNLVFKNLESYNDRQVCLPLHRDFKLHNILHDGSSFHLIDFDFAAIDNIGIEIVSFILDFYYSSKDIQLVEAFIDSYKSNTTIPIDWSTALNDYMVYMCCNTFPFYMRDKIGEDNFRALYDERNHKLHFTYTNKQQIYESLSR